MASYATYRHVELDRVGVGKKRVLKPPGGGSSIVFDEDDHGKPVKSKPQPQPQQEQQEQPEPQSKEAAPKTEKQEEQPSQPQEEAGNPKPETNGMNNNDCVKEDAAATRNGNPSPATNGQQSPALNGPTAINGSSAINGSVSSGSTSSMSPFPGGTPKHLNTQTRIFGEDQNAPTPRRRLRDHERSNIFAEDATSNGTHRPVFRQPRMRRDPVTGVGVLCWDLHAPRCAPSKWKADSSSNSSSSSSSSNSCPSSGTPEARTPEQPQPQQRQRVPPGGFSTRLW